MRVLSSTTRVAALLAAALLATLLVPAAAGAAPAPQGAPVRATGTARAPICHWAGTPDGRVGRYVIVTEAGGITNPGHARHTLDAAWDPATGCPPPPGSGLTIVFAGETEPYGIDPTVLRPIGTTYGSGDRIRLCESAAPTNCVEFPYGTTPGTSLVLTLTGSARTLTGNTICWMNFFASSPTAAVIQAGTGALDGTETGTTTATWSNGETVYVGKPVICGG